MRRSKINNTIERDIVAMVALNSWITNYTGNLNFGNTIRNKLNRTQ